MSCSECRDFTCCDPALLHVPACRACLSFADGHCLQLSVSSLGLCSFSSFSFLCAHGPPPRSLNGVFATRNQDLPEVLCEEDVHLLCGFVSRTLDMALSTSCFEFGRECGAAS